MYILGPDTIRWKMASAKTDGVSRKKKGRILERKT